MNKEFAPYDLALALKELGFDNFPCLGVHYCDGSEFELKSCETQYYAQKGLQNGILAPTYSQAFRWFRENYNLDGYVIREQFDYEYRIKLKGETLSHLIKYYLFYEEAELECLRKLIEIVKDAES